jgi:hypothetical protein
MSQYQNGTRTNYYQEIQQRLGSSATEDDAIAMAASLESLGFKWDEESLTEIGDELWNLALKQFEY